MFSGRFRFSPETSLKKHAGFQEAPKLWEEARDRTLTSFVFYIEGEEGSLRQRTYHPSLWFVVQAPRVVRRQTVLLPDNSDPPDVSVFGEHKNVAMFLVYVCDFLAAGPRDILQLLLNRLLDFWKGSNPDFLGREPEDVNTMRFLGLGSMKRAHGL